jgi:hypothetical protein
MDPRGNGAEEVGEGRRGGRGVSERVVERVVGVAVEEGDLPARHAEEQDLAAAADEPEPLPLPER